MSPRAPTMARTIWVASGTRGYASDRFHAIRAPGAEAHEGAQGSSRSRSGCCRMLSRLSTQALVTSEYSGAWICC